ncbi:MAG TPA: DUF4397 domain-containing protein [Actinomycetota bacterium]|jgi:hypothetical protein|nr:DUF4397 domain-containing protein [Actinomycetota bacterium]
MVYGPEFRAARRMAVPLVLLALLLLAALPAVAVTQESQALVRLVHLAPGAPKADVYIDGTRLVAAVPYKTASKYHRMPASVHTLTIRPAGSTANSAPAASARVSVLPGAAYTVVLLGAPQRLQVKMAKDDFSAPPSGKAKLRIVNAAPQSPPLDIGIAGGPTLFSNVTFGMISNFATIQAGRFSLEVRAAGSPTVLFTQGASRLPAGAIITVAGTITSAGRIEMLPILDAAGAGNLPRGGVATGAGGTAGAPLSVGLPLVIGLFALVMLAARRRQRSRMATDSERKA